ncbi:Type I transmembrane sorting receptor [Entomortierella chlamydospora]|uniref:rhizopuspepsin n=1 Tax=Entomortierella chlamydospora TaxID=101097 RepID=A0A9P6N445_9FUNG|nr:Type I transmembrane sorting receptor [Entomortierella chlamydospora]KAG0024065.1 Type I transmembrane sorting receptor [Entomortierella chlamydospora]
MKFTATILSLAIAALAFTEAAPTGPAHSGHEIPLVRKENHKKNFRSAMSKLANRYPELNLSVPRPIHSDAVGVGKVPLTDVGTDSEYYGSVSVGTPAQTVRLDFDTGSSDIWFPTTSCTTSACKSHKQFNSAKSSTYKKDGRKWTISYGDGSSASGILGSDMVSVGGVSVRQTIGLATSESSQFAQSPEDGLFGLGFDTIESVQGVKTFMDNAIAANALKKPVVSAYLPSVRRNGGKGGAYIFGDIDTTKYTGNLTYVPVTRKGYWQIAITGASYNNKSLKQSSQGIIDTGTTLIIIGTSAAAAVHKNIKGAVNDAEVGGWTVPCSIANSKDTIGFTMGGKSFKVPVADLAWSPVDSAGKTCYSGVQGGQDGLWILGDVFIKNNYCVFSQTSNPSIGIAPLK